LAVGRWAASRRVAGCAAAARWDTNRRAAADRPSDRGKRSRKASSQAAGPQGPQPRGVQLRTAGPKEPHPQGAEPQCVGMPPAVWPQAAGLQDAQSRRAEPEPPGRSRGVRKRGAQLDVEPRDARPGPRSLDRHGGRRREGSCAGGNMLCSAAGVKRPRQVRACAARGGGPRYALQTVEAKKKGKKLRRGKCHPLGLRRRLPFSCSLDACWQGDEPWCAARR